MDDHMFELQERIPPRTQDYLARRLDGARDLYLLSLAVGLRSEKSGAFGRLIQEARIHFAAVIEEAKIAGLDTSAISQILGDANHEFADSFRPEIWEAVKQLARTAQHTGSMPQ